MIAVVVTVEVVSSAEVVVVVVLFVVDVAMNMPPGMIVEDGVAETVLDVLFVKLRLVELAKDSIIEVAEVVEELMTL